VRRTAVGSIDPREVALQAGFLRLVSVTEATVDTLGVELTAVGVVQTDEVISLLILEKELSATSNWDARRRSYKRHHHVDLRRCAEHARVEAAVDVRNAIAHGLGKLTTRQALSAETPRRLSRLGIPVVNGYVHLTPDHLNECASYCAAFLASLDVAVA
jgi:hypothetical protein